MVDNKPPTAKVENRQQDDADKPAEHKTESVYVVFSGGAAQSVWDDQRDAENTATIYPGAVVLHGTRKVVEE